MQVSVFVNSIVKDGNDKVVVEASNGSFDGPPFVRFCTSTANARNYRIGDRLILAVTEGDNR